ncbi:NAD(P)H-dependent oxidoreductase [Pannonibacter sp. Pt2-lr]
MRHPKILVFSGSIRGGSLNTRLAGLAAKRLALADAEVTRISLADYQMPIYDGDLEQEKGPPEAARKLKRLMQEQHGVFIACPEYNAGMTPLLKNTLDWVSRVADQGEAPGIAFKNRVFCLGAASPALSAAFAASSAHAPYSKSGLAHWFCRKWPWCLMLAKPLIRKAISSTK